MGSEELEQYIRQYHGMVYRLAYSYVRSCADAEDISQDAFLRLYSYNGDFASDDCCKAWLIRVTINLSKNLLKSSWFRKREELDENLSYKCESREDYRLLQSVMKLPQKYREAIHLYYYEGYSVKEIAEMLGVSSTAITTRLARAREKLKAILQKEDL